jgi:hypothetical protein
MGSGNQQYADAMDGRQDARNNIVGIKKLNIMQIFHFDITEKSM